MLSHYYIEDMSRREANLSFIAFSVCCITFWMAMETACNLVFHLVWAFINKPQSLFSYVNNSMSQNGLLIFLIANLLTGVVNLGISTKACSSFCAILILCTYLLFLNMLALYLNKAKLFGKEDGVKLTFDSKYEKE